MITFLFFSFSLIFCRRIAILSFSVRCFTEGETSGLEFVVAASTVIGIPPLKPSGDVAITRVVSFFEIEIMLTV